MPQSSQPNAIDPQADAALQRQLTTLREKVRNLDRQLLTASSQNTKLVATLETAKSEILKLKGALEGAFEPPQNFATVLAVHPARPNDPEGIETADVLTQGRKVRVGLSPAVPVTSLGVGQEVLLNESLTIIAVLGFEVVGDIVTVKERLGAHRALVTGRSGDERVVRLAATLALNGVRVGDAVTLDGRSGFALEKIPRSEVENLLLEEVPDVSYADIGGLGTQIEHIRDAVELPFLHPELYREHGLKAPKGILLYGPPGCGKTLIAKAVAQSLASTAARNSSTATGGSYFLNIKGPELLDKYVGESERQIRLIFARAREKALDGGAVVVFFDEMDSLFRTRGSGVSSDVETTIVPQLLSELDGVEKLDNVIVIGASNREDMIDPAILRPGRLDVKIRIQRPDQAAATEIFEKYVTPDLPYRAEELHDCGGDPAVLAERIVGETVTAMYAETPANEFLELTYAHGGTEILYFKDFASGAVIRNIVDRAKKNAIKDLITSGIRGLSRKHFLAAVSDEFREQEDLPNTTNPDEWARISGRKGDRIRSIRSIVRAVADAD